jgi:class 3 adenylate cyclase
VRDPAETTAPTVLVADSALSSATTSDNDIICTLPSEKAAISPGIAAGGAGRPPRDRSNSKTYDAEPAVVMHLPPALKRGVSRQNTPKGSAHFSSDILKDLRIESIGPEGPPRTEGPPSAQGLNKNYSSRSVNFSNNTSFSDVTDPSISRPETPLNPDSIEGALRITRAGVAGVGDSSESSKKGSLVPFSAHKPLDGKKRFGSWGVMKNALRRESFREKYKTTEAEFMQTISKFVPRPVLNAVHTECLDLIGELRQVTTMFVGLDSYSAVDNKDPCTLQPFFLMAQTILHESGGFLRQFLVDDKGCVFIAMWGVPSFTYSNNCSRALYCAARILDGTAQLKHKVSIGIATGTVFCGSVGALERRDYAGVGTDVNMAARLMGKAQGRILIDGATYRNLNVESQTLLKQAEEMHLKGMAGPMTPYQYASTALPRITDIDVESNQRSVLRPKMQSALSKLLDTFLNISTDSETLVLLGKKLTVTFIFLFGLPGTGKALAAQFYRNAARLRSINCLHLVAKADSQGIPYGLLRELFLELIGRGNFATLEQKLHVVTKIIDDICDESDTEEDRNSALESLQLVLGIEPEDMVGIRDSIMHRPSSIGETGKQESSTGLATPSSRSTGLMIKQCSSQNRKFDDYTFYNAVAHLLHNTPTVLIIENAHFIDELSWKELFLMQAGDQLDMSVLLTMEVAHIPDGRYQTVDTEALAAAKKRSANVMNQSFSGDYWDAKEGQEALEHSEAAAVGEDYEIIPEEFPTIIQQHSRSASVGAALTPTLVSAPSTMSGVSLEDDPLRGMTIRSHPNEFWCSILDNTSSTVLVMGELNREEVKQEMARVIEPAALTDGLVDLVYNITSGNAYWVKAMTQFIRERGAEAVFNAVSDRRSRQNPLKQLVLVHFETHMPEYQVISKHASIIGVEFDEETLRAIVPPKLKPTLAASLDSLVAKRFLQCLDPQDRTFSFPNQLIQATIYELTPPR